MDKNSASRPVFLFALAVVLLAIPKPAQAYVDPGAGAMMWQLAAAVAIGCLFYTRRVFIWVRHYLGFSVREERLSVSNPVRADGIRLHGDAL